jgi:hypothetical protein
VSGAIGVDLISEDVERVRAAVAGLSDPDLWRDVATRGLVHLNHVERTDDPIDAFVHLAATVALYRLALATGRDRFRDISDLERSAYEQSVKLDREVLPPLKEEAKRLRMEIRSLEASIAERGTDPDLIEPRIDWGETSSVDDYAGPRLERPDERRRSVAEFFGRIWNDG